MTEALGASVLGLVLGARHALEPDHLAAVGTLMSAERAGVRVGALWGVGHTAALLAVGLVLGALRAELPAGWSRGFELGVAAMLLGLGGRALWRALRGEAIASGHTHASRPLLVGLVHGLAGSGALTALAVASTPALGAQLAFMILFGVGSVVGMAAVAGTLGLPLGRLPDRGRRWLGAAAGACSIGVGVELAIRIY